MNNQRHIAEQIHDMRAMDLLELILKNPYFLADPYYAEIPKTIHTRHEELKSGFPARTRRAGAASLDAIDWEGQGVVYAFGFCSRVMYSFASRAAAMNGAAGNTIWHWVKGGPML